MNILPKIKNYSLAFSKTFPYDIFIMDGEKAAGVKFRAFKDGNCKLVYCERSEQKNLSPKTRKFTHFSGILPKTFPQHVSKKKLFPSHLLPYLPKYSPLNSIDGYTVLVYEVENDGGQFSMNLDP